MSPSARDGLHLEQGRTEAKRANSNDDRRSIKSRIINYLTFPPISGTISLSITGRFST